MIQPFNKDVWQGRTDVEDGVLGQRWHQLIQEFPREHQAYLEKAVVFLGFASDEGVRRNKGRVGAASSPDLIRKMLSVLPKMPSEVSALYDYGNIICVGTQLEEARSEQISVVKNLLAKKTYPLVLGGGHEVALGNFIALNDRFKNIGIINIDAHLDMRIPHPDTNSGTGFYEMYRWCEQNSRKFNYLALGVQKISNTRAIFERAETAGAHWVTADEIHAGSKSGFDKLEAFVATHDVIYLSLDMDVFDAAFAPGVSAPATNGLTAFQVKNLIHRIFKYRKVRLMDVAEFNPNYDIDSRTARLAAHMISEMVHSL
ncbi:MAG: formimidoylglutamase [Flavobacteriaceae bacterium]|nr:formimidoylglutamase [Flavobacteriaceae bacterium]